jgi:RNA polymerase sporulation-specific sigma factor
MMGLFKAIRSFDATKEASFRTFAELCVHRQIVDAIRGAARRKHSPLNESLSLDKPMEEGEEKTLRDLLRDPTVNLEERVILNEEWEALFQQAKKLFSPLEWVVWNEYINGKTKREIAWSTGHSTKSIDNALQRMKRKLMEYLATR